MSINKVNGNNGIQAYNKLNVEQQNKVQTEKNLQTQNVEKKAIDNSSSKVNLSSESVQKQLSEIKSAESAQTSKVEVSNRQARLDEIAQQIKANTFKVNPEAVADKMLKDSTMVNYLLGM